jgi:hypothetical protein
MKPFVVFLVWAAATVAGGVLLDTFHLGAHASSAMVAVCVLGWVGVGAYAIGYAVERT